MAAVNNGNAMPKRYEGNFFANIDKPKPKAIVSQANQKINFEAQKGTTGKELKDIHALDVAQYGFNLNHA